MRAQVKTWALVVRVVATAHAYSLPPGPPHRPSTRCRDGIGVLRAVRLPGRLRARCPPAKAMGPGRDAAGSRGGLELFDAEALPVGSLGPGIVLADALGTATKLGQVAWTSAAPGHAARATLACRGLPDRLSSGVHRVQPEG